MDKKNPNIIDMEKYGTVLEYEEGYSSTGNQYLANGLIETSNGDYLIWKLRQDFDYDRLKNADTRWSKPYIASSWGNKNEAWQEYCRDHFYDLIESDDFFLDDEFEIESDMTYDEMVEHVENIVEYKGQRYGRNIHGDWEPNY